MEGKSGINFVLTIIAILFVAAGVVLCVLFGINKTIPGIDYEVELNLYVGLAGVGIGLLMLIGCNIATNARITADNTYDALRHVELLCKREGISMADLARKDAKIAKKEAALMQKEQAKAFEAQAQALAQAQAQMLAQVQAQAMAEAQAQQAKNAPVATAEVVSQPAQQSAPQPDVQSAPKPVATQPAVSMDELQPLAPVEVDRPLNCGIEYAEWKAKMEPIAIKCGTCGGEMNVRNTKKGIVVLACKNATEGKCKATPIPVDTMAQHFVEWYNIAFGGNLTAFDMNTFVSIVGSVTVADGTIKFAKK